MWREFLISDQNGIQKAGRELGMHPLAIEDCLKSNQRAKFDDYETHQLLVWFVYFDEKAVELEFVRFDQTLVLVASRPAPGGKTWKEFLGVDRMNNDDRTDTNHLLYRALDAATDKTEETSKTLFKRIEEFETSLFRKSADPVRLLNLKKQLARMDLATASLVSVVNQWQRALNPQNDLRWKVRDLIDHCERTHQGIVFHVSQIASSMDMYWGMAAKRTNEQIKKLTLIASVAIPINVWAAIWGMNFQAIPFDKPWLLALAIVLMAVSVTLVGWFLKTGGYLDE